MSTTKWVVTWSDREVFLTVWQSKWDPRLSSSQPPFFKHPVAVEFMGSFVSSPEIFEAGRIQRMDVKIPRVYST